MTIFGTTQALFLVEVPPRPPTPATQKSYILSEGQGQDDIEVTHIDGKKNVVTFDNHGVVQEIPLVKAPPINTPTPVVMNTPGVAPGGYNNYRGGGEGGNAAQFGDRFGQNQNPNMATTRWKPDGRDHGGPGFSNTGSRTPAPAQQRLAPEEQMIMIAAQHAQAQQAVRNLPYLPAHRLGARPAEWFRNPSRQIPPRIAPFVSTGQRTRFTTSPLFEIHVFLG